jgi:hypothetical protein
MKKDYFILVIILLACVFTLFLIGVLNFYPVTRETGPVDARTYEEALNAAQLRVLDSYQYNKYGGHDLELVIAEVDDCEKCWTIGYEYDVNESLAPANVKRIEMVFAFDNSRIANTTYSEIIK